MTCIVALKDDKNNIWFGGDSAAIETHSLSVQNIAFPKVFAKETPEGDTIIFGFAGTFKNGQVLKYKLQIPERPSECIDDMEYLTVHFSEALRECLNNAGFLAVNPDDGTHNIVDEFLMAYRGNIYSVFGAFEFLHTTDRYICAGSGRDIALGSLFTSETNKKLKPKDRCVMALQAAASFNAGVRAPFTLITLKYKELSKKEVSDAAHTQKNSPNGKHKIGFHND
jgi:ATP-dependent protease HslVU (ClpYQ) peptidase subunit